MWSKRTESWISETSASRPTARGSWSAGVSTRPSTEHSCPNATPSGRPRTSKGSRTAQRRPFSGLQVVYDKENELHKRKIQQSYFSVSILIFHMLWYSISGEISKMKNQDWKRVIAKDLNLLNLFSKLLRTRVSGIFNEKGTSGKKFKGLIGTR